jgi:hypothetical protein
MLQKVSDSKESNMAKSVNSFSFPQLKLKKDNSNAEQGATNTQLAKTVNFLF